MKASLPNQGKKDVRASPGDTQEVRSLQKLDKAIAKEGTI